MNRLVREHYPVSKLPEDLREGFEAESNVRVTVDVEPNASGEQSAAREADAESEIVPKPGLFSKFRHLRRVNFESDEDVDAYVNALRDEWSDRGR